MGMHMDLGSVLGLILGIVLLVWGIVANGELITYWNFASILITLGGTIASVMINFPMKQLAKTGSLLKIAFTSEEKDPNEVIDLLVSFAESSRRDGLLALEEKIQDLDDDFLKKGIQLVVDGTDADLIRSILQIELAFLEERHQVGQKMFDQAGAYAPAYGMIGTLIGLIAMLVDLDDPDKIGAGMATALITTLYGVLLSNLVFLPIAGKLRDKSAEEILLKEVMIEGILSIQAGENPRIVEEKLRAFIPANQLSTSSREAQEREFAQEGVTSRV